ncbi:high nitrogen upregulated cytochrome P450 monooxygenase 2 [Mycena amicta]|nr:high nitrogen upregulated cytochrome P450 monooxygenase 2 [Mycena amicta]
MATKELVVPAVLLGLANHVYFRRFEPTNAHCPLFALIAQPILLTYLLNSLTFTNALIVGAYFIGSLVSSIIVYRLSPWHPLAHIPGPMMAKVSKLWAVKLTVSGNKTRVLKELHDQHGDFVRTGPNEISVIHADAIRSVLGTGGLQKGSFYDPWSDATLPTRNLLNMRDDNAHANRRRIWNRGMSTESMRQFEGILANRLQQLLERLDEIATSEQGPNGKKGEVDVAAWISYLTFDFMGDMAFGGGFNMIQDRGGSKDDIWNILKMGTQATAVIAQVSWIFPTFNLIPGLNDITERLRRFASSCAEDRIKSGPKEKRDLWYHLMDEDGHEKTKPTLQEVVVDGVLAIVAGSDTSSTALISFIWCMLTNPEIYARVRAEVDAVYPDPEAIYDSEKHGELTLLTACLHESLRLFPPVSSGGPRQVPIGEARVVAGQLIPEHTQIYLPSYVIHRNPKHFFPAPDKFDPDRWLRSSNSNSDSGEILNHATFLSFSYGAANCAAKHLAWRELLMVTSALIKRYDMRFAPGKTALETVDWIDTLGDFFVTNFGKLMVEISLR